MAGEETSERMFISYKESDNESINIAKQLRIYLEPWGIECVIIKNKSYEGENDVKKIIFAELGRSNYFLQILASMPRSDYMQIEWETAQAQYNLGLIKKPIVLHTDIVDNFGRGCDYHATRIGDEDGIQALLKGMLKHKFYMQPRKLYLPECFRRKKRDERIVFNNIDELLKYLENFKDVHDRGLERIYPSSKSIIERIENKFIELSKQPKKEVRLLGFTLKRFVIPDEDKPIGKAFKAAIDEGATAKLLLLDRECQAARERTSIESPDKPHKDSLLVTDNQKVVREYTHDEYKGKVDIRYYETPYFGMVLFEDEAFVETYNLGTEISGESLKEGFCGKVPIMLIRRGCDLYPLFESHFENVWNLNNKKVASRGDE